MNTLSEWIILFGGIIATIFFNKIRTQDIVALGTDSKTDKDIKEAVRIPIMILVFVVGIGFMASAIYNIFDLSILSVIISMSGYLVFRFYKMIGLKLDGFMRSRLRFSGTLRITQFCSLIIGVAVVVIGLLNLF